MADQTCSICFVLGKRTPAIKGWDGVPICGEHVADSVANTNGEPKTLPPSSGFAPSTLALQ